MVISYGRWRDGWRERDRTVTELASAAGRICEIGAGARPLLEPRDGYVLLDIDPTEIAKAGTGYESIVADVCSPDFAAPGDFDLVFSLSTAEHVADPYRFHLNVRRLLRDGGVAVHFFPTLYSIPFVANLLLSERVSETILLRLDRSRAPEGQHAKFPAFYRWCRGPSARQIGRLESCGFAVERYDGYFGHSYYQRFGVQPLMERVWAWMAQHPAPSLTSYGLVVMRAVQANQPG